MTLKGWFNPVVWTGIGVVLIYELIAVFNRQRGDTVSAVVWDQVGGHPWIAGIFGALIGHFFLQSGPGMTAARWWLLAGLAFGAFIWKRGGGIGL